MYIPKNKIKTDQYTRGGEYQSLITGNEYVGSYWLMYNGKIFSGVDPNDTPQEELVPFRKSTIEPIIEEGNDFKNMLIIGIKKQYQVNTKIWN